MYDTTNYSDPISMYGSSDAYDGLQVVSSLFFSRSYHLLRKTLILLETCILIALTKKILVNLNRYENCTGKCTKMVKFQYIIFPDLYYVSVSCLIHGHLETKHPIL